MTDNPPGPFLEKCKQWGSVSLGTRLCNHLSAACELRGEEILDGAGKHRDWWECRQEGSSACPFTEEARDDSAEE